MNRFVLILILLVASFLQLSCDTNTSKCDYFESLLPNDSLNYVIMKIDIHCEQCLVDLRKISDSETPTYVFISRLSDKYNVNEKVAQFDDERFIIIQDKHVQNYFQNTFINVYPTYYRFDEYCQLKETNLNNFLK